MNYGNIKYYTNFYCDDAKAANAFVRMLSQPTKAATRMRKAALVSVVDEAFRVVMNIAGARIGVSDADIILRPPLSEVSFFDFHKAERIVKIGYEYAMDKQGELKRFAIKD